MPKILQLSSHIANMIAAGEVVERPASVVKELLENSVDAGATQVAVEIRDGGMTFIRVTDNGCGMLPEDARTAFLRHATSKLRTAEDLTAISTMGFRGEALAAIASVSRIDLLTRASEAVFGTALTLEAGTITDESEAGCPEGTTIIIRDLFFNTPARMKFMKSDVVEGSRITAAVQQQALAHPEVAFRLLRDGKQVLSTPGSGKLTDAIYCVYGKESARMIPVDSSWEKYHIAGLVTKPTDARPSRSLQTFFVNDRPVKSRLLMAALEEAYRNQIMVGKFPGCVLHLTLPANLVDVNVHPAKTEVKFLNEKAVFDCVHYGVLAALNKTADRPEMQFKNPLAPAVSAPATQSKSFAGAAAQAKPGAGAAPRQENFFRTMTAQEYKIFSEAIQDAPQPSPVAAAAMAASIERKNLTLRDSGVMYRDVPDYAPKAPDAQDKALGEDKPMAAAPSMENGYVLPPADLFPPASACTPKAEPALTEPQQESLTMPEVSDWRLVGELYNSYILVEQGEDAFLIDKHAAHERILFDKLKANQEAISSQSLLAPIPCRLSAELCGLILSNRDLLEELGFEVDSFGDNTLLLRQIPMDLSQEDAKETLEQIAADLAAGRRESRTTVRDEVLHTVACKAAIKAGWVTDRRELEALAAQVMAREDLKYCPHGRPICISLSKKQLEKQFKRS